MSLKDIEKLKEKVDKDPNSKLFVPLAEEYRKEGMLDDAIAVLQKGIEQQPGYMSARVSLGKIYVEKGMLPEARGEFEHVVKSIPDNLFAQKKLAEIYRDTGERDLAIRAYKTVLKLNNMDEEAQNSLSELEGGDFAEEPAVEPSLIATAYEEAVVEAAPEAPVAELPPAAPSDEPPPAPLPADDELNAFQTSIFGAKEESESPGQEAEAIEDEIGVMDEADEGAFSFADVQVEVTEEEAPEAPEAASTAVSPEPEDFEISEAFEISEDDVLPEAESAPEEFITPEVEAAAEAFEISEADVFPEPSAAAPLTMEEPFVEAAPVQPAVRAEAAAAAKAVMPDLGDADRCVASGDYSGAISIYRQLLTAAPNDRKILQRIEELKTLLKLMGKDKEVLIGRLNAFLEGIQARRDEFYGRS